MKRELLSPNLPVVEFLHTNHVALLDDQERYWLENERVQKNARRLARSVFQPARDELGALLTSSGLRCPPLNAAVGGSGTKPGSKPSAHMDGRAIDVVPVRMRPVDALVKIRELVLAGKLPDLDKAILEFGRWIHLQVAREGERPAQRCLMTFDGASFPAFTVADPRVTQLRRAAA